MVYFPTQIPDCDSCSTVLLDLFISAAIICFTIASLHWEIMIMLLSWFPLTFHQIHNRMPCFIAQLMTILVLIGMVSLRDKLRDFPWEDILKISASAAAGEFCG